MNVEFLRPDPRPSRYMAYPWNIQFDWKQWIQKGILDEATLRTFQYSPEFVLNDTFSNEVISLCREYGIPLHYNRYLTQTPYTHLITDIERATQYIKDIELIYRDGRFHSFIVYETANIIAPDSTKGVTINETYFDSIRAKSRELETKEEKFNEK